MIKVKSIPYEQRIVAFVILTGVSAVSLFAYIYAINATARNIAQIERMESDISDLSNHLSSLEFEYVEKKNDISLELAYQYGFREVENPLYVSRNMRTTLTLNTNR